MNRTSLSALLFSAIFGFSFTIQASSMLSDDCSLPLNESNYENCSDKIASNSFNYEKSIWKMDKEEPFLSITDDTRYPENAEWQSMGISNKVLNEVRNECALSNRDDCIIFDND
ncbi:hypothetical protein [Aliivibrio sifiae]|uniref:DUF4189 domain-containing protein n=2 Tax=Aliivibrio sifiae TaxID=566293 RepID=A0A2S7X134_9GAMM|nr:hypothetical protein [Aliivibrio sifiae]PQJ83516.1 hypothetical protein BTO23_21005 [Aliivibrio sifiae]